jgi:hypothetical protein
VLIDNYYYYYDSIYSTPSIPQTVVARVGSANGDFVRHFGTWYDDFNSRPFGLDVDSSDNIYVTIAETEKAYSEQYRNIRKLSATGDTLANIRLPDCDTPATWDQMRVDRATGEVYFSGSEYVPAEDAFRMVVEKFSFTGNPQRVWRSFGPAQTAGSYASTKLVLGPEGITVGATGYDSTFTNSNYHVSIARFTKAGALQWCRNNADPSIWYYSDYSSDGLALAGMITDAAGNVLFVGSGAKWGLVKFAANGDLQFVKPFPDGKWFVSNGLIQDGRLLVLPDGKIGALCDSYDSASGRSTTQLVTFTNPATVPVPLAIPSQEPADQTVALGGTVTFSVSNAGSPATYQWRKEDTNAVPQPLAGQTGATLTIASAQLTDGGKYSVVLTSTTNPSDVVTSRAAKLLVYQIVPLADALDGGDLTFTTGGANTWFGQTGVSNAGGSAAHVVATGTNQKSWFETTVTGPGTITFDWKTDASYYQDFLNFVVDGDTKDFITGSTDWATRSYEVAAGMHTIRWSYDTGYSTYYTKRLAWVDNVQFTPAQPIVIAPGQPEDVEAIIGDFVVLSVNVTGTSPRYQWFKGEEELVGETYSTLYLYDVQESNAGQYHVVVSNVIGPVTSRNCTLTVSATPPPDNEAPVLASVSFTPDSVDVTTEPRTVTFTAAITDVGRGLSYGYVELDSPSGTKFINAGFGGSDRISGTSKNGAYQFDVTVPRFSEPGDWMLTRLVLVDIAGNQSTYALAPVGLMRPYPNGTATALEVINTNADLTAPALLSLNFAPTTVNVSASEQTVGITLHATDNLTGVVSGSVGFRSPSGKMIFGSFSSYDRVSGDASDGTYQFNATVRRYLEAGVWKLFSITVRDDASNESEYNADTFPTGTTTTLTVQNTTEDTKAPTVMSMTLSTRTADVIGGSASVTATMRITDAPSGFAYGSLQFYSPSGQQYQGGSLTRTAGTAQDGTYSCEITIPQGAEAGVWRAMLQFGDNAGNYRAYWPVAGPQFTAYPSAAQNTITVRNGPDTVEFASAHFFTDQDGKNALITVTRVNASANTVTVHYATSDGTAQAGEDYTAKSGTITFKPADTTKTFTIPIKDDNSGTFTDETVNLSLTAPTGGAELGHDATAVLTIFHNDGALTKTASTGGTIVDKVAGTYREAGRLYTVVAKPDDGYLFDGWTGIPDLTDAQRLNPTLKFVMMENLNIGADFVVNRFPGVKGTYTGIVAPTGDAVKAGLLTITTTATPTFTGKLLLEGSTFNFSKLAFRNDGSLTALLVRPSDRKVLTLTLQLDLDPNGTHQISGSLLDGAATLASVTANLEAVPPPVTDAFTFAVPTNLDGSAANPPQAYGFGTISIGEKTGLATVKTTLIDGLTFTASENITFNRRLPVYYYKAGTCLAGTLIFDPTTNALSGTLRWWKPGQTTLDLPVTGGIYSAPLAGQNILDPQARAKFGSGAAIEWTHALTIANATANKVTPALPNLSKVAVTITGKTGGFSGSFTLPGEAKTKFGGVFLTDRKLGVGCYRTPAGDPRFIIIEPATP